jgi:hypothetical protein
MLVFEPVPPFLNAQGRPLLSTVNLTVHFPSPQAGGAHQATVVPLPIYMGETFDEALARFCDKLEGLVPREGQWPHRQSVSVVCASDWECVGHSSSSCVGPTRP